MAAYPCSTYNCRIDQAVVKSILGGRAGLMFMKSDAILRPGYRERFPIHFGGCGAHPPDGLGGLADMIFLVWHGLRLALLCVTAPRRRRQSGRGVRPPRGGEEGLRPERWLAQPETTMGKVSRPILTLLSFIFQRARTASRRTVYAAAPNVKHRLINYSPQATTQRSPKRPGAPPRYYAVPREHPLARHHPASNHRRARLAGCRACAHSRARRSDQGRGSAPAHGFEPRRQLGVDYLP